LPKPPFKLSVISDEVSQDLEVVAKFAYRHELDGIELRTVWNLPPQRLVTRISDIKRILSEYGLKVSAIASPFFKSNIDNEEEYKEHIEILRNCIKLAKAVDTDIIRGFTFWRRGKYESFVEKILEKFNEPLEIVEAEGIILAIENEPATFVTNGRLLADFLSRISSRNVRAVWDPGNDIWDPYNEVPYPDGYEFVKEFIVHVHVKDGVRCGTEGKPEARPIGEGDVDYRGQIAALIRDGFKGYISLETHWRPKAKLSEELIVRPGGQEFSAMGEEASEICINKLKKIIGEVTR